MPALRLRVLLSSFAFLIGGCQTAGKFADQHTFGPMLGPCASAMDSVTKERGKPFKRIVGDEEDVSSGQQAFEHEWGYPLDPPVADSVEVVRFRWTEHYKSCRVDQRTAKRVRSGLLLPWTEAPDSP